MAKIVDSTKIEKAAVQAVRDLIQPCERIDHKIDEDDKNKLVDGSLEIYSSSELSNANLIGRVEIQVKGTTSKLRTNRRGFVKYPLEVENLWRYLDIYHGLLFLCASVDKEKLVAEDVYYAQLLPYDISKVLSNVKPEQKTVSVRLKPFPREPREIIRFLIAFNADRERQLKADVAGYGFLSEDYEVPSDIKSVSFSVQLFPGEEVTTFAGWREGTYLYGEDESGRSLVFDKMEDVLMFARGVEAKVSSGDFELTTMVLAGECEDGRCLKFEGASMVISDEKVTFNYKIEGGFRKRYNTASFAHEFIRTGELWLNDNLAIRVGMGAAEASQLSKLKNELNVYRDIVETLDTLNIAADWDPTLMSEKEINDIGFMWHLLVQKEHFADKSVESPLVHFDIQGSRIYAFAHMLDDGSYEFIDLQSADLFFVFGWPDEKSVHESLDFDPVPPVVVIGEDGFKKIVNLDPTKFESAFGRLPITAGNQYHLNQKLLEMLAAYDEGCQQPDELLACSAILARKLHEYDIDSETYMLNLLQTVRRKRELHEEERRILADLAIASEQMSNRAAAYALLGDADMADNCYNRCSEFERSQINGHPISIWFKKAIRTTPNGKTVRTNT